MPNFFKTPYLVLIALLLRQDKPIPFRLVNAAARDTASVVAPGATLQLVSGQFQFTEGPAADSAGNIFFTDQPSDEIWKFATNGTLTLFTRGARRSNGLYIDKKGVIFSCADEKNQIIQITPQRKITVLYEAPKRRRLNGPNDLWVDAGGGVYITDPYYQRPYWKRKKPALQQQHVYYLPKGKRKLIAVEETLAQPNGIVGTPDGRHLFIADIGAGKTYKYEIATDGTLTNKQLFINEGSDGITLDSQGNLYLTGNGVTVYNSNGEKREHIDVPATWTSNVCFGGAGKNRLFITASEAVYTLQMRVHGVE